MLSERFMNFTGPTLVLSTNNLLANNETQNNLIRIPNMKIEYPQIYNPDVFCQNSAYSNDKFMMIPNCETFLDDIKLSECMKRTAALC